MKQVLQSLSDGSTVITEAPAPLVTPGTVLINSTQSLISAGTERMLVDFGNASYLDKARQQPEKVKMVLEKVATDGLAATVDAVRSKLAEPLPLGYCNVGVVAAVGAGVTDLKPGDRVASNGPHADVVRVGRNLCARIPDVVSDEAAAFTVVASIGLQGIRLARPALGEAFVVTGAGLIGLLTIQLLRAHGCRVLAIDPDPAKLVLAERFGASVCNPANGEDPVAAGLRLSRGKGVDGVIITASTSSNDPVRQAARMSRTRGRIVLVGVTGLQLDRADFYEKELSFQVSCSYGPGRYDPSYEEQGNDYPYGLVRWTEQRNFQAVLDMMADGRLDVAPLISHRFPFDQTPQAYRTLTGSRAVLGILLQYDSAHESAGNRVALRAPERFDPARPVVGFIGAGNYASRVLIPAFKAAGAQFSSIATSGGINGVIHGAKAGFAEATTDVEALLADPQTTAVAVATRHNSHADFVCRALDAGKHVFVEKPLALTGEQLDHVEARWRRNLEQDRPRHLMVGFNRRFAPQVQTLRTLLDAITDPKSFIITVNAGALPGDHWTRDPEVGGGRILGEACHFIDLMRYLAGAGIVSVQARGMGPTANGDGTEDNATVTLGFADGSLGTVHYLANGSSRFPKERVDVFAAGRTLQLDNFRALRGFGWPGFKRHRLWRQDKGQRACAAAFLKAMQDGAASPIPVDQLFEVSRATIEAAQQLRTQQGMHWL